MAVVIQCKVTNANNGLLYGNTLTQAGNIDAHFYNADNTNLPVYCNGGPFELYMLGLNASSRVMQNSNTRSCDAATTLAFQARMYYGESVDVFPNEYRPDIYMDSVVITWDPTHYVYTSSSPAMIGGRAFWLNPYTLNYTASAAITPTVNTPGKLVFFNASGNWPLSEITGALSTNFIYNSVTTSGWLPTCATPASSPFTFTFYYRGNYYTYNNVLPQTALTLTTTGKGYVVSSRPSVSLQNNTGVVQGVLPQHYWDVQISNNSNGTAPYVWLALSKTTASGISIDSVVLQPSGVALTPASYGSGNTWYQVSATGLPSSSIQKARIYFKYSSCITDSIQVSAGWNCTGYPANPLSAQCGASSSAYLKVIPMPGEVQIAVARQPGNGASVDMCTTDSIIVVANSAQSANLVNPYVRLYPPSGFTLSSTVSIEYPFGSGIWQTVSPVSIAGGGYQINLNDHTGIGINGLPGTISNSSADARQAKIKLPYSVSCGFVSGSQLDFYVYGNNPCGTTATGNGSSVKTNSITVTGSAVSGGMGMSESFSNSNVQCEATSTFSFSNIPV